MQDQQEAHPTFLADPRWHASKTISPPMYPRKEQKAPHRRGAAQVLAGPPEKSRWGACSHPGWHLVLSLTCPPHPDTTWDCQLGQRQMCSEVALAGEEDRMQREYFTPSKA